MYELLQEGTPYPPGWPDDRDGILLQTKWQRESGRSLQRNPGDRLFSWWPNINWTLSMWQIKALQQRGELANIRFVDENDPRFDLPQEVADDARRFYDALQTFSSDVRSGNVPQATLYTANLHLRQLFWSYHTNAIRTGVARNEDLLAQLSVSEQDFANSWGKGAVEILAAANFPVDSKTTAFFQQRVLPNRLVEDRDYHIFLQPNTDLPFSLRSAMVGMRRVYRFERATGGFLRKLIERFVQRPGNEVVAARLIEQTLNSGLLRALLTGFDDGTAQPAEPADDDEGGTRCGNSPATAGAIDARYRELGGCNSVLGAPTTSETTTPDGVGRFNHFQKNGSIYWTPGTGAHEVHGSIRTAWAALGWERSVMGYPTTGLNATRCGGGYYNGFQGGAITWSNAAGAHETHGPIRDRWQALGFECSRLGFPKSDVYPFNGGFRADFERGFIVVDARGVVTDG